MTTAARCSPAASWTTPCRWRSTCPIFTVQFMETPSPFNPLGVKGMGETPTIAAVPAIANAVADALSPLGETQLDIPLKPERVWRAIQGG